MARKVEWVPATLMAKLVSAAWHEGYNTALANCETAVYQGEDALSQLLNEGREKK